jgi:hypothetical protein
MEAEAYQPLAPLSVLCVLGGKNDLLVPFELI